MTIALLSTFAILMLIGVPIAFVLTLTGIVGIYLSPGGAEILAVVPQEMYRAVNSFPLLTIPLFILAGVVMAEGGVARRLMDLAEGTVGRGRGGLAAAIVISTMFLHGISGSSTADTAAIGRVTLPTLKAQGYPIPFSTALLAASGATATLIPPTIDLIIIGVIANISIAGLFAGGVFPAIVNGLGLIAVAIYISWRRGYGRRTLSLTFRQQVVMFFKAFPALMMIVIILGGILGGIFTPTEASVVAVVYGFLVAGFVYRDLSWKMLPGIFRSTLLLTGVVMFVIAGSTVVSYALTINHIPQSMAAALDSFTSEAWVFLLLVQIFFFIVGMLMDGLPALLLAMPILTPIAISKGVDPIHFGILVEANVALGLATPPVGMCLYAACAVSQLPLEKVIKPLLPFIAVLTVTMFLITYVAGFTLWLPRLLGFAQ
jgi:tripartite ATP-independent transporter DctM subunit